MQIYLGTPCLNDLQFHFCRFINRSTAEAYSELTQTSRMEHFTKIVNSSQYKAIMEAIIVL